MYPSRRKKLIRSLVNPLVIRTFTAKAASKTGIVWYRINRVVF